MSADIRDEFGRKIGEVSPKPDILGGGYVVTDDKGRKKGEINPRPDPLPFYLIIIGIVLFFFLPLYFFFKRQKSVMVLIPAIVLFTFVSKLLYDPFAVTAVTAVKITLCALLLFSTVGLPLQDVLKTALFWFIYEAAAAVFQINGSYDSYTLNQFIGFSIYFLAQFVIFYIVLKKVVQDEPSKIQSGIPIFLLLMFGINFVFYILQSQFFNTLSLQPLSPSYGLLLGTSLYRRFGWSMSYVTVSMALSCLFAVPFLFIFSRRPASR